MCTKHCNFSTFPTSLNTNPQHVTYVGFEPHSCIARLSVLPLNHQASLVAVNRMWFLYITLFCFFFQESFEKSISKLVLDDEEEDMYGPSRSSTKSQPIKIGVSSSYRLHILLLIQLYNCNQSDISTHNE